MSANPSTAQSQDVAGLYIAAAHLHMMRDTITDAIALQLVVDAIESVRSAINRLHAQEALRQESRRQNSIASVPVLFSPQRPR